MSDANKESILLSRRAFVSGVAGASLLLAAKPVLAFAPKEIRKLCFTHTHTGESMDIAYYANGKYVPDALHKINYLMRDFRANEQHHIDPTLLDRLTLLQRKLGSHGRYEIISGYRSPQTNAMLRANSDGVAKKSMHLQGKAIDMRLTDVSLERLHTAAMNLNAGGVGLYRTSDFIHLDTGEHRHWGV